MVKIDTFLINLDSANRVFYAGQLVTGKVILVTRDSIKLKNLLLKIDGHAKTHWTEQHNRTVNNGNNSNVNRTETIHFSAEQEYIHLDIVLMGQPVGYGSGSSTHLPAGTHQFSFQFQLPVQCATSFEGTYGHIRYAITAIVDRPWKFDHTSKLPFTVIAQYDLNYDMTARDPLKASNKKTLGALFWKSGDLAANVYLKHRGFVAGQPMNPVIEVVNDSKKCIKKIKLQLKQTTVFHAYRHHRETRQHTRCVAEASNDVDIPANETKSVTFANFTVPAIPPVIINCSIIEIYYELYVSISPSGMSFDLDLKIPIIIGTVPVMENFHRPAPGANNAYPQQQQMAYPPQPGPGTGSLYPQIPGPGNYNQPNYPPQQYPAKMGGMPPPPGQFDAKAAEANGGQPPQYYPPSTGAPGAYPGAPQTGSSVMPSAPPLPEDAYPDLAPPSYQECVTGRTNIREEHEKHTYGDLNFAPSYPCYNLATANPAPPLEQPGESDGEKSKQ